MRGRAALGSPAVAAWLSLLARLGAALWLGTLGQPRVYETEVLARSLLDGKGYAYPFLGTSYHAFHCILPYDLLTTAVYALSARSHLAMQLAQWLLSAVAVLVVARLGARLDDDDRVADALGPSRARRTGPVERLAAYGLALHPGLVYYDATRLHQVGLDALLVLLVLLALARAWEDAAGGWLAAPWLGLASGLCCYERPTLAVFLAAVGATYLARGPSPWRRRWARVGLEGLVMAALLLPWLVRNQVVLASERGPATAAWTFPTFPTFPTMATTGWLGAWKGNHPGATGSEFDERYEVLTDPSAGALPSGIYGEPELVQEARFRALTMAYWRGSPSEAARLYGRKLAAIVIGSPHTGRSDPAWMLRPALAYEALLGVLAVMGLGLGLRRVTTGAHSDARRRVALFCAGLPLSFLLLQALLYVALRHRITVDAALIPLAALAVHRWLRR